MYRSQWLCGLRRTFDTALLLGWRVRISLRAWCSSIVFVVGCVGIGLCGKLIIWLEEPYRECVCGGRGGECSCCVLFVFIPLWIVVLSGPPLRKVYARTSLTVFAVFLCVFIYLPDDDLAQVETCRRNIHDKWWFTTDWAFCWIKYCIFNLPHGIWFTLNNISYLEYFGIFIKVCRRCAWLDVWVLNVFSYSGCAGLLTKEKSGTNRI